MITKLQRMEERRDNIVKEIYDLEYDIEVHTQLDMTEIRAQELAGKVPMIFLNGRNFKHREIVENTLRTKEQQLEQNRKELKFLDAYIDSIKNPQPEPEKDEEQ